jgi:hypothetical protein
MGLPGYPNPFSDLEFLLFDLLHISDTPSALHMAALASSYSLRPC